MVEVMVAVGGGVEICVEEIGDRADPTVLLVHGAQASMLWWPDELCEAIAAGGRHVVRYDQRDTGRSSHWPPGAPAYAMSDLAADAVAVLDRLGVDRAHVVGRSMGGGVALFLAVDHADRVRTLTLVTTTSGEGGDDEDDGEDDGEDHGQDHESEDGSADERAEPADWAEAIVATLRGASGGSPYFDEDDTLATARRDVERSRDVASSGNHFLMELDEPGGGWSEVTQPVLVVQGELDPWFPPSHGRALVDAVPDGRLLVLPGTGHDVPRPVWDLFVRALLGHTSG